jgi:hypothetical protein
MKMSALDRAILLGMSLLAAYQVAIGIEGFSALPIVAYSIAFGVLLVAGLLLIILGFEALDAPVVVILSTVIPLSLSVGLVWQHLPALRITYLAFAVLGLLTVAITRRVPRGGRLPVLAVAIVHGIAGLIIFGLPIALSASGAMRPAFVLVGLGGGLIGVGGLLLAFMRMRRPILPRLFVLRALPLLLLVTTALFVAGFRFGLS